MFCPEQWMARPGTMLSLSDFALQVCFVFEDAYWPWTVPFTTGTPLEIELLLGTPVFSIFPVVWSLRLLSVGVSRCMVIGLSPALRWTSLQELVDGLSAISWSGSVGVDSCPRFSVEWDQVTARVCAANVNGVVIGEDDLREGTFQWPTDGPVVLNVDVDSRHYRDPVSRCNILLVVGSPSCQPWSRGSHALGFGHKFGLHVISFLGVVTLYMPPFIVLENVLGLLKHVHWRWIEKLFFLCGYQMIAGTSEEGPVLPISRDRSVVIFGRMDNPVSDFVKETIPRMRLTCDRERTVHAWAVLDMSCSHFVGQELDLE